MKRSGEPWAIDTACDVDELSALVGREATADDFEPANWSFAELGRSYSAVDAARFKRVLHQVARHVAPFFEEYDFYMSPTLGSPPVAIGTISPLHARFTSVLSPYVGIHTIHQAVQHYGCDRNFAAVVVERAECADRRAIRDEDGRRGAIA